VWQWSGEDAANTLMYPVLNEACEAVSTGEQVWHMLVIYATAAAFSGHGVFDH